LGNLNNVYNLTISGKDALTTLNGLQGLERIGLDPNILFGGLSINNNNGLISLEGLNNLHIINAYLRINRNESLVSLNGLNNLETIGHSLEIGLNPSLVNLDALSNLTEF